MFLFFQKSLLKNPVISFGESTKNVLGLFTTTPSIIGEDAEFNFEPSYNSLMPTKSTPSKSEKKKSKKESSKESDKDSTLSSGPTIIPTVVATPSDLEVLYSKIDLIKNAVESSKNGPTSSELIEAIFEHQLVDTFGAPELSKVFGGITDIYFTGIEIVGNEAKVTAIVQFAVDVKTYSCFFVKQDGKWFLYKTESL